MNPHSVARYERQCEMQAEPCSAFENVTTFKTRVK